MDLEGVKTRGYARLARPDFLYGLANVGGLSVPR